MPASNAGSRPDGGIVVLPVSLRRYSPPLQSAAKAASSEDAFGQREDLVPELLVCQPREPACVDASEFATV